MSYLSYLQFIVGNTEWFINILTFSKTQNIDLIRRYYYKINYVTWALLIFDWICWGVGRILWWRRVSRFVFRIRRLVCGFVGWGRVGIRGFMISRFVLGISWLILWVSRLVSWFCIVRLFSWIFWLVLWFVLRLVFGLVFRLILRLVLRLVFGLVLRLVFGIVAWLLIIGCLVSNNGCN